MRVIPIFAGQEIAASGSSTSAKIDLAAFPIQGYFSLQFIVTGDGTCKFEYLTSNDGVDYVDPSGASDIASSQTKTSGSGSDGKDQVSFSPLVTRYMKIKCTETGTSDSVTVSAHLAIL